jgi:hypothetical protein
MIYYSAPGRTVMSGEEQPSGDFVGVEPAARMIGLPVHG